MIPVQLAMHRFSTLPEDIDEGCCLRCDVYLDLSQPDAGSPARMIGICNQCGRWYVIDLVPGTDAAVMVLLPDVGNFQDALANWSYAVAAEERGRPIP